MFNVEFERLKSIAQEQRADEKLHISDFSRYFLYKNYTLIPNTKVNIITFSSFEFEQQMQSP